MCQSFPLCAFEQKKIISENLWMHVTDDTVNGGWSSSQWAFIYLESNDVTQTSQLYIGPPCMFCFFFCHCSIPPLRESVVSGHCTLYKGTKTFLNSYFIVLNDFKISFSNIFNVKFISCLENGKRYLSSCDFIKILALLCKCKKLVKTSNQTNSIKKFLTIISK